MKPFIILCLLMLSTIAICGCQERADNGISNGVAVVSSKVDIQSGRRTDLTYLAVPEGEGPWPGVVLLHSLGGLHAGYRNLTDKLHPRANDDILQ